MLSATSPRLTGFMSKIADRTIVAHMATVNRDGFSFIQSVLQPNKASIPTTKQTKEVLLSGDAQHPETHDEDDTITKHFRLGPLPM